MKKVAAVLVIGVIIVCLGLFFFGGINGDSVSDEQNENSKATGYEGEGGGNPDKATDKESDKSKMQVVNITVSYDQYWCEEKELTLDEIIDKLDKIEGDFYVKVKDDKATHKAYSSLISKLQELEINVEESK